MTRHVLFGPRRLSAASGLKVFGFAKKVYFTAGEGLD